jgi:hypothetical protein
VSVEYSHLIIQEPGIVGNVDLFILSQPSSSSANISEESPNVRGRKRKTDLNEWKKSIRKRLRNNSKEHVNTMGKRVQ